MLALLLVAPAFAAAPVPTAVQDGAVVWSPDAAFSQALVTLTAPSGLEYRHAFTAGESVRVHPSEIGDEPLADGFYGYELVLMPTDLDEAETATALLQRGTLEIRHGAAVSSPLLDQVFNDDLIVRGSGCFGQDCVNGENFGFDTVRLKENNLRIHFDDTSNSGSFPSNDWRITINDSANGGQSYFSIDDATGNRSPLRIRAGAPNWSIYVAANGPKAQTVTGQVGALQKQTALRRSRQRMAKKNGEVGLHTVIDVDIIFEKGSMVFRLTFDADQKISGLGFLPPADDGLEQATRSNLRLLVAGEFEKATEGFDANVTEERLELLRSEHAGGTCMWLKVSYRGACTYTVNVGGWNTGPDEMRKITEFARPHKAIVLVEGMQWDQNGKSASTMHACVNLQQFDSIVRTGARHKIYPSWLRHFGTTNVGFQDGHVDRMEPVSMATLALAHADNMKPAFRDRFRRGPGKIKPPGEQ